MTKLDVKNDHISVHLHFTDTYAKHRSPVIIIYNNCILHKLSIGFQLFSFDCNTFPRINFMVNCKRDLLKGDQ